MMESVFYLKVVQLLIQTVPSVHPASWPVVSTANNSICVNTVNWEANVTEEIDNIIIPPGDPNICGSSFTDDEGTLISHSAWTDDDGNDYNFNADCTTVITAANPNQRVSLQFVNFDVSRIVPYCSNVCIDERGHCRFMVVLMTVAMVAARSITSAFVMEAAPDLSSLRIFVAVKSPMKSLSALAGASTSFSMLILVREETAGDLFIERWTKFRFNNNFA